MFPIFALPNFKQNLETIAQFWTVCQMPKQHLKLVGDIDSVLYPNLEGFPRIGRPFTAISSEDQHTRNRALALLTRAQATLGGIQIREYLLGDYLVLYGLDTQRIYLIAIKHHKQAGFSVGAI
jgi:hypothetical protein